MVTTKTSQNRNEPISVCLIPTASFGLSPFSSEHSLADLETLPHLISRDTTTHGEFFRKSLHLWMSFLYRTSLYYVYPHILIFFILSFLVPSTHPQFHSYFDLEYIQKNCVSSFFPL